MSAMGLSTARCDRAGMRNRLGRWAIGLSVLLGAELSCARPVHADATRAAVLTFTGPGGAKLRAATVAALQQNDVDVVDDSTLSSTDRPHR